MSKDIFEKYQKRADSRVTESQVREAIRFWRLFWAASATVVASVMLWWWAVEPTSAMVFSVVVGTLTAVSFGLAGIMHLVTRMGEHNKTLLVAKSWGVTEDE